MTVRAYDAFGRMYPYHETPAAPHPENIPLGGAAGAVYQANAINVLGNATGPYAAFPPNINVGTYNFPPGHPRRFTTAGEMNAYDAMNTQRINWNIVPEYTAVDALGNAVPAFRFSDVHAHFEDYTGAGHDVADVFVAAKMLGIRRFTWTPIPTTLVNRHDDQDTYVLYHLTSHCGEQYYVPIHMAGMTNLTIEHLEEIQKHVSLRVSSQVDDKLMHKFADAVRRGDVPPKELNRVDLPITGIDMADRRNTKHILEALWRMKNISAGLERDMVTQYGPNAMQGQRLRFTHLGEVTLRKEVVDAIYGHAVTADLENNIAATREAMRLAGIIGMPWILHCDADKAQGLKTRSEAAQQTPLYIESIKKLMRECPNTEIIWAHAGGLGRFVKETDNHLAELEKLMRDPTLNHVKLDISWSVVAEQIDKDPANVNRWAQFLTRHADRIIFGTDTLNPKTTGKWTETYDIYQRRLFAAMEALRPGSTDQITLVNYERVMVDARERVDCFVDYVIPQIIKGVQGMTGSENIDLRNLHYLRDTIYAQNLQDPSVHRTATHFANRDRHLFEPEPRKARSFGPPKAAANVVAGTHRNYEIGSARSGDPLANRNRQKEASRLSRKLNEIRTLVAGLPGPLAYPLQYDLLLLQGLRDDIYNRLGTSTPPDQQLCRMRAVLHNLIANVLPPLGINVDRLKIALAGKPYTPGFILPPVLCRGGYVAYDVPLSPLPPMPPPILPLRPGGGGDGGGGFPPGGPAAFPPGGLPPPVNPNVGAGGPPQVPPRPPIMVGNPGPNPNVGAGGPPQVPLRPPIMVGNPGPNPNVGAGGPPQMPPRPPIMVGNPGPNPFGRAGGVLLRPAPPAGPRANPGAPVQGHGAVAGGARHNPHPGEDGAPADQIGQQR